jgi:hypothetical protein
MSSKELKNSDLDGKVVHRKGIELPYQANAYAITN